MIQDNNTTKARGFKHLSEVERGKIEAYMREGFSVNEIASRLRRNKSTISRELRRGLARQRRTDLSEYEAYFAETGQAVYENHRKASKKSRKIGEAHEFIAYAEEKIMKEKWSPDAVVGFAKTQEEWLGKPMVCTKTLYNYIDMRLMKVKNIDLPIKVRLKPKIKRIRKAKKQLGRSIDERPAGVENRQEFGHWEIDSVIGNMRDKGSVLTLVERKTRMMIAMKLDGRGAEAVNESVSAMLDGHLKQAIKSITSITSDNGSEFTNLKELLSEVYYAHPYSSWERGTNERHNGLLRRFVKKGESIDEMHPDVIKRGQEHCNTLPRKILGYKTPQALFEAELKSLTVA